MCKLGYKREQLARHNILGELRGEDVDCILALGRERRISRGQVICRKGEDGSSMMIVLRGRIRISAYSKDGREITYTITEPGGIVGEMALLDGHERSADATAMSEGVVFVIERRDFIPLLERNPRIAIRLLEILCERVRRNSELIEDIAFLSLPVRLSRLLLKLAETYGRNVTEGRRIDLKLSQRDLGSFIAACRESVNKQLKTWQEGGLIAVDRGIITLRCPEAMKDIAEAEEEVGVPEWSGCAKSRCV